MSLLNASIPSFKALVPVSHFTKTDGGGYYNVYCFGIQSVAGKILTFHVMTDDGMVRARVPLSSIYTKEPVSDVPYHFKQLWDCFSENTTVNVFDFLVGKRCQAVLRDGSRVWATYRFTVDWFDNPYSDEPSDYKCGHILDADDGYILCLPNNRILWRDSNWVTKKLPIDLSIFKVDEELPSVESVSDRWVSEDSDCFYYKIHNDERS
jgi:hypothetical protein